MWVASIDRAAERAASKLADRGGESAASPAKGRSPDKEPRPFLIHPIAEKEGVLENQASGTTSVLIKLAFE